MLRAGVMATRDVNIEWRLDVDTRLAPVADLGRVKFGVGGGKPAAGVAGAGDQPGADLRGLDREPDLLDGGDRKVDILVAYARDQKVLPDGQANIAVAQVLRDFGEPAHLLAGDLTEWQGHADPVQPFLLLLLHTDMGHPVECRPRRQRL